MRPCPELTPSRCLTHGSHGLFLAAVIVLASCRGGQPRQEAPDPLLGPPAVLLGRTVAAEGLQGRICEGRAGAWAVERATLSVLVADEVHRREAQHRAVPVPDADPRRALQALFLSEDAAAASTMDKANMDKANMDKANM